MVLFRILAWLLFAGAVFSAGLDGLSWAESGEYAPIPVGQVWAAIHQESLTALEPALARLAPAALWDDAVFPVLMAPAWMVAAAAGLGLWVLARPRLPRRRRRPDWR